MSDSESELGVSDLGPLVVHENFERESSTKDAQFIALQQQHKERMSKMDELVKARNEQNKVEEMKIMFMDTSA
ncbi:hypothetical protein JHK87_024492 [Glycine soja]|nr:hypothetical protein JHK87_024492 [Glycine soja]